jgi:hypothetical protein
MKIQEYVESLSNDMLNGLCIACIVDEELNIINNVEEFKQRDMVTAGDSYILLKIPLLDYIGKLKFNSELPDNEIKDLFMEEIDYILNMLNEATSNPSNTETKE